MKRHLFLHNSQLKKRHFIFPLRIIILLFSPFLIFHIISCGCSDPETDNKNNLVNKNKLQGILTRSVPLSLDSMRILQKINEKKHNDVALTFLYREIGEKEYLNANFLKAIQLHRLGLESSERIKDTTEIVNALNNLGKETFHIGMFVDAADYYFRAFHITNIYSNEDTDTVICNNKLIALNGIGNVAYSINLLDTAEYYFREALDGEITHHNIQGQAIGYANLGSVFKAKQMYDSALVYYKQAMNKNIHYGFTKDIALCRLNIGKIYTKKNQYGLAEEEYLKAYNQLETELDKSDWLDACLALAQLKLITKKYDEALNYIFKAKPIAEQMKSYSHLSHLYNVFCQYEESKRNYSQALKYYKLGKYYADSISNAKEVYGVINTRLKYEKEKNIYNIEKFKRNSLLQSYYKSKRRIIIALIILFLFIISLSLLLYAFLERTRSNKILKSIEQMRSDFFTKITHEFRTPLTVILGLSKQLKLQENIPVSESRKYLTAIEREGEDLLNLVNQLLDIAKLETCVREEEWKTGNIVAYIEMLAETISLYAKEKNIEVIFYSKSAEIETDFVPDYMTKILQNLLSNAIKYSHSGDKIWIILEQDSKYKNIIIKVIDNGEGIEKENLPHIFKPFYQVHPNKEGIGSGIGLTLVKQLVDILHGEISVESKPNKGSVFTIKLPLQRNENYIFPYWKKPEINQNNRNYNENNLSIINNDSTKLIDDDSIINILLVEDNKDLVFFLRAIFPCNKYNILYARNGEEGLSMAMEWIPDIVITDIIMPVKDGLELCAEMRASELLSHIPIIILTAKNSDEAHISGFKSGADAFMQKPFNSEELKIRVEQLLEMRNRLKEKYGRAMLTNEKNVTDDVNIDFLQRVADIIYKEMKNADFSPKKLAEQLSISISQLNKKLNATIGSPASNYILQIKIAYAKKILASSNKNIGEVAAECGIYDVNYFARVFKRYAGVTPSQYQHLPR